MMEKKHIYIIWYVSTLINKAGVQLGRMPALRDERLSFRKIFKSDILTRQMVNIFSPKISSPIKAKLLLKKKKICRSMSWSISVSVVTFGCSLSRLSERGLLNSSRISSPLSPYQLILRE